MLFNKKGMFIFFCTAYVPLFLILCIKFFSLDTSRLIVVDAIIIACLIFIYLMNRTLKRTERIGPLTTEVKIIETKNSEYVVFIITYLVPFFTMDIGLNTIVAFIVLFMLIGYIYVNSSLFSVNPTLKLIWGYNIYQGAIDGDNVTILTKKELKFGFQDLRLIPLSNEVYLGV